MINKKSRYLGPLHTKIPGMLQGSTPVIFPYIGSGQCLFRCKYNYFPDSGNNKFNDCFGANAAFISSMRVSLATNDTTG